MVPEDSSPTPDPQAPTVDIDRLAADPTPLRGPLAGGSGAFQADDVLAERYRIVRFLARGGMGEVYEAHDHELRERVALKVIRSEIARDERAMERFRREIALARKVTHGNVCRTFDIEHHRHQRGVTAFVTMELLEGETLADRLRRAGRLGAAEALPIVRQMVAGLAAAHEAGIVHRDFKSGNVMLVPRGEGLRAVITDFGLASGRPGQAEGTDAETSSLLVVAGTPQYMSPEQVAGGPVTPASDVYALGVVLYEMVTGTLPFSGDTPLSVAVKRLQEKPAPPSDRVAGLDAAWTRTILRCLERDPQARFASVTEVAAALEGAPVREARRRRRLLPWALAATLLVLAALVRPGGSPWLRGRGPASPPRRAVAVLGFRNLTGQPEAAWLSTALAEMVASELGASPGVRVVSGEDVARMKLELGLSEPDSLGAATLARVRRNVGADFVVLGSYLAGGTPGQRVRVDVRLQDAAAGETVASLTETGAPGELSDLVSRSGERLRAHLGAPASADEPRRAVLPRGPGAARAYSEGLARLRVFDAAGARPLLESAVAAEPQFALTHSALAAAWAALGYDARARAAAQEALRLGQGLPREQRLFVEARYRESGREWDQAIALYQSLARFFPDDLDYGLRLAETQVAAGRARDAVATVEALRRLPPPASLDARVDLAEAAAAEALADDRRAQVAAARAADKGTQAGARLLLARARLKEGAAFWRLNEQEAAAAAAAEARGIFAALGDELGVAQTLNVSGNVRRDR
ncbi:MAG TPA: protein kinase, partial [Vicinamibacteria bacterium]|nr:protein kinase [Vicinamibacteria bacterium]